MALHPICRSSTGAQVERLEAALNDPLIRDEAAELLRELIEKVVLVPRAGAKALDAVPHGDLARILQLCEAAEEKNGSRKRKLPVQGSRGVNCRWLRGPQLPLLAPVRRPPGRARNPPHTSPRSCA